MKLEEFFWMEELTTIRFGLRKDGIMEIHIRKDCVLDLEEAQETVRIIGEKGKGQAFPNLLIPEPGSNISKKARSFSVSEEANAYTLADGILVQSVIHRMVANAFMSIKKPAKPTQIFTKEKEALDWLKCFLR